MEVDCDLDGGINDAKSMKLCTVSDDTFEMSRAESLPTFLPDCILEKFLLQRKGGAGSPRAMTQLSPACDDSHSIIATFDLCGFTKMAEELKNEMSANLFYSERNPRRNTWGAFVHDEDTLGKQRSALHHHPRFAMSVGGSFSDQRANLYNYKIMKSQCTDVQARYGAERLRDVIGDFFHALMPIIIGGGGDILRLAGDALIVMFPISDQESSSCIAEVAINAARVAVSSVRTLNGSDFHGRQVHLRVVLDMGSVTTAIIGSQDRGWKYIVTGEPFRHLHSLLEAGGKGDVLVTKKVWQAIRSAKDNDFQATAATTTSHTVNTTKGGGGSSSEVETSYKLFHSSVFASSRKGCRKRDELLQQAKRLVEYDYLRAFMPRSVLHACEAEGSGWFSYIQRIAMVFINVDVDRNMLWGSASGGSGVLFLEKMQTIYCLMQEVVYDYGGSIKEFTVDDKGLVLMCAMGVPPAMGDNQPEKACLAALKIVDALHEKAKCNAWVGVSTGMVFTASFGTHRRELAMMGDAVNKAARLMMVASRIFGAQGKSGILVTQAAYDDAKFRIEFQYHDTVKVKNTQEAIACYIPVTPLRGGYAVFLPGNFIMLRRYSSNGENVAEVATTCVERLSRGDGGGLFILEGLPGLGKASHLQGLVEQWKKTFSPDFVKIIKCSANDEYKVFINGNDDGSRRIEGGGEGGRTVAKESMSPTEPGREESSLSSSSSTSSDSVDSASAQTGGVGHRAIAKGIQSGEEHLLSSWRPVLVSLLLALKDHVMSYAVACDTTFSTMFDDELLPDSDLEDSMSRFGSDFSDDGDPTLSNSPVFPPPLVQKRISGMRARFSTCGSASHKFQFPLDQTSSPRTASPARPCEELFQSMSFDNSESTAVSSPTNSGSKNNLDMSNSCPISVMKQKIAMDKSSLEVGNRTPTSGFQRSSSGSAKTHPHASSSLSLLAGEEEENLTFRLLHSLDTMSREKSAMPMWSHAFGAYPQAASEETMNVGRDIMDSSWARGMFLHFFFDLFMTRNGYVYWLIGDFLGATMPANMFPNENFSSLVELPFEKFPITLVDAIVEVLMLTAVRDLVPHMPLSFRAVMIFDTPSSLRGPNLQVVHRVLSKPPLANRFLFVALSTPLARAEGGMIEDGRLRNYGVSKARSSKLINILKELKGAFPVVQQATTTTATTVNSSSSLLPVPLRLLHRKTDCFALGEPELDNEEEYTDRTTTTTTLVQQQNSLRRTSQSQSSNALISLDRHVKTNVLSKTSNDSSPLRIERVGHSRRKSTGERSSGVPSTRKRTTAFHSLTSLTIEDDLMSLLVELAEFPHLNNDPNTLRRLQIAPVDFENCRTLIAWALGVDDVTDEAAVAIFMRTQGVPLCISKYTGLLKQLDVGSIKDAQQCRRVCDSSSLRLNPEGEGGGSRAAPQSIWGFNVESGGLGGTMCSRALSDIRLDGLVGMRSKIEGYLHSLTSQQLNILKILSCIGGVTCVTLDLFASTYDQFVSVSRDRGLEVDIGILCECGLVILSNNGKKREWSMKFAMLVVHQVVYWEIPEKLRTAVHEVGG